MYKKGDIIEARNGNKFIVTSANNKGYRCYNIIQFTTESRFKMYFTLQEADIVKKAGEVYKKCIILY